MYVCLYVCVFVCICVCMYVCLYVCMYVFVCMCVCMYAWFFLSFPFSRGDAGQLSLRCTATLVMFPIAPCCWPYLSTFLPPLPFFDTPSDNPPILPVVFLVFSNLLVSLSQIFSVICRLSF